MAPYIAALPWRLVRAAGGVEFLTSDAPVVSVTRAPGHLDYSLVGGWANPTSETIFALSPTHVLAVGQTVNEDRVVGSAEWCASVRDRTARNADRFVFARSADSHIGDLLASSAPPTPVVEFDGQQYTSGSPVGEVVKKLLDADHGTVIRWGPAR
jgi:hypothetical protein